MVGLREALDIGFVHVCRIYACLLVGVCEWASVIFGVQAEEEVRGCCLLLILWIFSASQSCQILVFNYQEEQKITTVFPTVALELGFTLRESQSDLIIQP